MVFTTLMAGPEPASRHESRLLAALSGSRPLAIEGDTLVIGSGDDELRFRRITDGPGESEDDTAAVDTTPVDTTAVDGQLRWTSDTHIPVSASQPTTGIDILVVPAS